MPEPWERYLERWQGAGFLEPDTIERIRAYEAEQQKARRLRWPVLLAIGLGGLLLGTGVLLFVAAHWEEISPARRFVSVLFLVALFHLAASLAAARFSALATTLHAVGTISLGAGIFLTGQIFNLQEHWPTGVLLWALGAWLAWALLRDWPQLALVAVLTPLWLGSAWLAVAPAWDGYDTIFAAGLLLLAVSYVTALMPENATLERRTLAWIGGLTLIPLTVGLILASASPSPGHLPMPVGWRLGGWTVALGAPLALAWWLRRAKFLPNLVAGLWVIMLSILVPPKSAGGESLLRTVWHEVGPYGMCLAGAIGLIVWGLQERRQERLNLGIAGFALTVLVFYFSSVMDKLDRAAGLVGLGLLFLLGGCLLEKTRRRLVAQLRIGEP